MDEKPFALEVASVRLVKDAPIFSEHPIQCPEDAVKVLGGIMSDFDREVVCVVNLKNNHVPVNVHFASIGALNYSLVHPRELFKASILSNAAAMLLMHCHPSGKLYPSETDVQLTDRMVKLCELMEIPLEDHIIVGGKNEEYFSFKEKGMIKIPKLYLSSDYRTIDFGQPLVTGKGRSR